MNAAPAGTPQAAAPAAPRAASATARTAQLLTGAARHPFIAGELKRIGILTAVVLVILIVLAFALPRFIL